MKILFPKPDEEMFCKKCGELIEPSGFGSSEDGDLDYNWCWNCDDFCSVMIEKKIKNQTNEH